MQKPTYYDKSDICYNVNDSEIVIFFIPQGRAFTFDKVFKPSANQELVYTETAKPIVSGKFYTSLFILEGFCKPKGC